MLLVLSGESSVEMSKKVTHNGGIVYYNEHGHFHREDGPAWISPDGNKGWFINGKRHREDGPAVIFQSGKKRYYLNGIRYGYEEWLDRVTNPILYKWREYCGSN